MTMRHTRSWQYQYTSEKIMVIEEISHGAYFLCGKSKPQRMGKKKNPCFECWQYAVLIGQAGHKRMWLSNIAKTRRNSPSECPPSQKDLSDTLALYTEDGVPQHCRETLGDCSGSQLFLSLLTFFCEVPCLHFLLTQLILFHSWFFRELKTR